jgi:hypothetical protein
VGVSDHLPVCASFYLPQQEGNQGKERRSVHAGKLAAIIRFKNLEDNAKKVVILSKEWHAIRDGVQVHPDGQMLEFLCRKTTEVVYKMAKKPKKPDRIEKSSSTLTRNASLHLQSLVRICRAIHGQGRGKKRHRTTARDVGM